MNITFSLSFVLFTTFMNVGNTRAPLWFRGQVKVQIPSAGHYLITVLSLSVNKIPPNGQYAYDISLYEI